MDRQPRVTDFVPLRPLWLGVIVAGGLATVAALAALNSLAADWADTLGVSSVRSLAFAASGNLAGWFASVLWLMVAVLCVLAYSLRRHKSDDYRGRYRVWLWAAGAALWLSADATAGLHQLVNAGTGDLLGSSGPHWWLVSYAPLLGGLVAWLVLDVRHSRMSTALASTAAVGIAAAAAASFGWLDAALGAESAATLVVSSSLAGQVLVAAAVLAYVRHVLLDVQGLLPAPKPAKAKSGGKTSPQTVGSDTQTPASKVAAQQQEESPQRPTADDEEEDGGSFDSHGGSYLDYEELDEVLREPRSRRRAPKRSKSQRQFRVDAEEDQPNPTHLSKAQRKRLRKQKLQQREAGLR